MTTTIHQYGMLVELSPKDEQFMYSLLQFSCVYAPPTEDNKRGFCISTVNQYASLECEFKDLKEKFSEEAKERRDLYNKLIEIKG
jgi:hypothetical protein